MAAHAVIHLHAALHVRALHPPGAGDGVCNPPGAGGAPLLVLPELFVCSVQPWWVIIAFVQIWKHELNQVFADVFCIKFVTVINIEKL